VGTLYIECWGASGRSGSYSGGQGGNTGHGAVLITWSEAP
jgi:hypothetical protein